MIRNFKICMLLFSMLTLHSAIGFAQKKINYGVGIDIFQTKLNNVDRENFSSYGHSVPGFTQNDKMGFGATFLVQTPIYKNLSFETGLGVTNFNSQFHFDYIHWITGRPINNTLNISLSYLNIPISVSYNFSISTFSKIHTSIGLRTKFLFAHHDNYQDILYELIGGQKGIHRYNRFVFSPEVNIGYSFKFNAQKVIRIEANAGYDINKFINNNTYGGDWGFYKNLSTASYLNYGLSLKYFFTK